MKRGNIESSLTINIKISSWIDCLGCQIKIRDIGISELEGIIRKNIERFNRIVKLTDEETFRFNVNFNIKEIMRIYKLLDNQLNNEEIEQKQHIKDLFIYVDECDLLSVPILSNTSPLNTPHFLIHVILSLGRYKKEIDALCYPNFRACLRAVNIIGILDNEPSLKKYSEDLSQKYIEEQFIYFSNLFSKSETYIVMFKGIFDDAIIYNTISINELPL